MSAPSHSSSAARASVAPASDAAWAHSDSIRSPNTAWSSARRPGVPAHGRRADSGEAGDPFEGGVRAVGGDLIEAARTARVPHFVQTTTSGTGQHVTWVKGRWAVMEPYYATKAEIQDRVREAGFAHWTLLKPSYSLENFLPSERDVFPRGVEGGLVSLLKPTTCLSLVALDDIGSAAAAAIAAPERFDGVELELAGDRRTTAESADILSRALGPTPTAPDMTEEAAVAAGLSDAGHGQAALNDHPQPAHPSHARALGLPTTDFETWVHTHLLPTA